MALREAFLILIITGISAYSLRAAETPQCSCGRGMFDQFTINCDVLGWKKMTFGDCAKLFQKTNLTEKNLERLSVVNLPEDIRIPSRVFEGITVRVLFLSFCVNDVRKWADEEGGPAFQGLENTLEELELFSSVTVRRIYYDYLNDKAPISLGHLHKLKRVAFTGNDINTFADGWFENGPSSVEYLTLKYCKTRYFGDRAFAALSNLKELDLSFNDFESLSRSTLPNPAIHLEKMDLGHNKLKYFSDDFFSNMPALKNVYLDDNYISHIKENIWRPVWSQLIDLSFGNNNLNCDDHINWTLKVNPPKELFAPCIQPKEMDGVHLEEWIEKHRGKNEPPRKLS